MFEGFNISRRKNGPNSSQNINMKNLIKYWENTLSYLVIKLRNDQIFKTIFN